MGIDAKTLSDAKKAYAVIMSGNATESELLHADNAIDRMAERCGVPRIELAAAVEAEAEAEAEADATIVDSMTDRERVAFFTKNAARLIDGLYDDYGGEVIDECPCCQGGGRIRRISPRVAKKRQKRAERFFRLKDAELRSVKTGRDKAYGKAYRYQAEYRALLSSAEEFTACPLCVACEDRDDEYRSAIRAAIDAEREWSDEYHRSEDYGSEYAYLVEPCNVDRSVAQWFDDLYGCEIPWNDLPDSVRSQITDRAMDDMRSQFVSGYSGGFDIDFGSFGIGEDEIQRDADEFRDCYDGLDGCPSRLFEEESELNYRSSTWGGRFREEITIYNSNDYDHWSYGLDAEDLATICIDVIRESEEIKRRDRESLTECLIDAGGNLELLDIDLSEVYVCYRDSIRGGNCHPGTRAYMSQHGLSGHMRASEMPESHLHEVRKAIRAASLRHLEEMESGFCDLSYHSSPKTLESVSV